MQGHLMNGGWHIKLHSLTVMMYILGKVHCSSANGVHMLPRDWTPLHHSTENAAQMRHQQGSHRGASVCGRLAKGVGRLWKAPAPWSG